MFEVRYGTRIEILEEEFVILAIDPGSTFGWATATARGHVDGFGHVDLKGPHAERFHAFALWLLGRMDELEPLEPGAEEHVLAYEDPPSGGVRSHRALQLLLGQRAIMELEGYRSGWRVVAVSPTALKRRATGKGNASKGQVLAAARGRWFTSNEHEADALWCLQVAMEAIEGE